jgi:hypothetical protein
MYDNSISVTARGSESASEVSAISRQMTLVQKLLAEHREVQGLVGQRLNAVLRPSSPAGENPNGTARPSAPSPMVTDLEEFSGTLQRLLAGYQDILNRLEL